MHSRSSLADDKNFRSEKKSRAGVANKTRASIFCHKIHAMPSLSERHFFCVCVVLVLSFIARPVLAALSHQQTVDAPAHDPVSSLLRGVAEARQLAVEYSENDSSSFASVSVAGDIGIVCVVGPYSFTTNAPQQEAVVCPASSGYTSSTQLSSAVITWCVAACAAVNTFQNAR